MSPRRAETWRTPHLGRLAKLREGDDTTQLDDNPLWFLTQNKHKFQEAKLILAPYGIQLRLLRRPKVEIQSKNLGKIAKFAAETAVRDLEKSVLVEDSGLFVDALGGFPGPFSSYVYATLGLAGVLRLMREHRRREAYFSSSVAVSSPFVRSQVFNGRVDGRLSRNASGREGFGFDPIFIPLNSNKTFAEAGEGFKNRYSHRALALRGFAQWYQRSHDMRRRRPTEP